MQAFEKCTLLCIIFKEHKLYSSENWSILSMLNKLSKVKKNHCATQKALEKKTHWFMPLWK